MVSPCIILVASRYMPPTLYSLVKQLAAVTTVSCEPGFIYDSWLRVNHYASARHGYAVHHPRRLALHAADALLAGKAARRGHHSKL